MSAVDIFLVIVSMAGGLALFMFGMNIMSKSLSSLTGGDGLLLLLVRFVRAAVSGGILPSAKNRKAFSF